MWTVFRYTFLEALHRRMAVVLLATAVLSAIVPLFFFRFETAPDGTVYVQEYNGQQRVHARDFVNTMGQNSLGITLTLWQFLGLFAVAPLLSSYMEKGSTDLLFPKGVSRAGIFAGRFLGTYGVYLSSIVCLNGISALVLWAKTGVSMRTFLVGVAIAGFSFLAITALMALVCVLQPQPAPAIAIAFVQITLSVVLAARNDLFRLITWHWLQVFLNWLYYILPKNSELGSAATRYFVLGTITNWMPFWSTGLFIVAILAACYALLRRKSF